PILFTLLGAAIMSISGTVLARLCPGLGRGLSVPWGGRALRGDLFLMLWLLLELVGFFALTPFGAVRRVMGIVVVGTLLAGRLAARTNRAPSQRWLIYGLVGYSAVLGAGFQVVDLYEGWTEKLAVDEVVARLDGETGTRWFVGHWGFQYYAERAG